jgi:hypothetical protein
MAVAVTAGLAVSVEANPAPVDGRAPVEVIEATPAPAPVERLDPPVVTQHPIDEGTVPTAARASRSAAETVVAQTVQLTIVGGPLELLTTEAIVVLEPVAGSERDWVGVLPPVRVVDARGTHEGWDVRWTVAAVALQPGGAPATGAKVRLEPSAPVVVAGVEDGVVAGKAATARRSGRTLLAAAEGAGGGTYEAGATVRVRLPASVDASAVTVHLAFDAT